MAEMRDRGQMILMTGIVLAVLFVALALLVNATIYTDNVATRGGDPASEALEYQSGVVASVTELVERENAASDDFDTIEGNVSNGTERIDDVHRQYHLRRGAGTNTSINSTREGRLIRQENVTGFADWTAEASAANGFVFDLNTSAMSEGDGSFLIDLDGTELNVNKTDGNITVEDPSGNIECEVPATGTVRFNVSDERLEDESCGFTFPEFDSNRQIGIDNGTNGAGSYELSVESNDDLGAPPDTTEFIYSVELDIRIDTPELSYERTVRIVAGGPDV